MKIRMMMVLALAAATASAGLYEDFAKPPQRAKAWTYWFWSNSLTDRQTLEEEAADIAALGFGGILLTDSRGYWDDEDHVVNPPAKVRWGSDGWRDLIETAIRACAKNDLTISINIAASGGHLRGDVDAGADNPKFLMCRYYLPGDAFEQPAIPHYRDVAVFAVKTAEPAERGDWKNAGDGYYSMAATGGKRSDGQKDFKPRAALETKEILSAADGAKLGDGWTIVRFGAGSIKGQEVDIDVLDRTAVVRHLDRVFGPLLERIPGLYGRDRTFANLYNVSWEGSMPTWSATFERDFRSLTGYAIRPLLPALAGFTLAGTNPDALMRDFRHARGEMMSEHLYATVRAWAHARGMGAFSESGGPWVRNPQTFGECDQLKFLAANDFPQGEYWPQRENSTVPGYTGHANLNGRYIAKGIVSAAHVYDRRICSVEAFTHMHRHWSVDPAFLKPTGDQAYADGINLLVWHTYTTSPKSYGTPGLEYFAGSHINRNVTWHDDFAPMVAYLNRCQALLQRGEPVTDIAALCGDRVYCHWATTSWGAAKYEQGNGRLRNVVSDEINVKVPSGFMCDLVNDDAIARNPALLKRYRVVYDCRKKENLGKTIPVGTLKPDVETASSYTWCHRRDGRDDVYFLAGEGPATLVFRASAPAVELWDAVTGLRHAAAAEKLADGRTRVSVDLPVGGSAFVVFRAAAPSVAARPEPKAGPRTAVAGPWNVSFAYHKWITAAPPKPVTLEKLVDFRTREDLKYFAGTAAYKTTFAWNGPADGARLSLGEVPTGLAHVWVNGKDCGTVWCAPWTADISSAVKEGANALEIRYTNNWYNRLVGDCFLDAKDRVTKSVLRYWQKPRSGDPKNPWSRKPTIYSGYSVSDPLQKAGLLGPVETFAAR